MTVYVLSCMFRMFQGEESLLADDAADLVADECRAAGLAFLEGAGDWEKRDLVEWLQGPYHSSTRHVRRGARITSVLPEDSTLDRSTVHQVIRRARYSVLSTLAAVRELGMDHFAVHSVERGQVVCARSASRSLWVPADVQSSLVDRVHALFAVDALLRPHDYEQELFVCADCEGVSFDVHARARGSCPRHTRKSGINLLAAAGPIVRATSSQRR